MFRLLNAHYDGVDFTLDLGFDIRPKEGAKNLLVKNKHKKYREKIDFISKIGKFVNQFLWIYSNEFQVNLVLTEAVYSIQLVIYFTEPKKLIYMYISV